MLLLQLLHVSSFKCGSQFTGSYFILMAICHVAPDIQTCYTLQKYVTLCYKTLHLWVGSALSGQGGVCALCTVNWPEDIASLEISGYQQAASL